MFSFLCVIELVKSYVLDFREEDGGWGGTLSILIGYLHVILVYIDYFLFLLIRVACLLR